jgi:hypothetical protein
MPFLTSNGVSPSVACNGHLHGRSRDPRLLAGITDVGRDDDFGTERASATGRSMTSLISINVPGVRGGSA